MAAPIRWSVCLVATLWLTMTLPGGRFPVAAQSDLDTLMREVIGRRDENWTKLSQYVLDERERLAIRGADGATLFGEQRDFTWYIRDGFFVRSPVRVNGAAVGDGDRRAAEAAFLARETRRERRRAGPEAEVAPDAGPAAEAGGNDIAALISQGRQPQFISSAYFLRFAFESGRYALVGRETLDGRETLKVEYYPSALFRDSRRPDAERRRNDPVGIEMRRLMNKVSLVTLWVEPDERQILKYTFDNVALDFLPTQWFSRVTDVQASMTMAQPFPGVWLPRRIDARIAGMLAVGRFDVEYETEYVGYRQADVGTKIVPPDRR